MKNFSGLVAGLSRLLDKIAALCMISVMVLVVANILLRALLGRPILGTYEYVGFLTAAMIGLALASCALQNGHIAVSFVMEKLPARIQACVDIIINVFALSFWGLAAWYTGKYASGMTASGVVSPTTQTPFYPFVYLVSFGLLALCLVLLAGLFESIKRAAINK
jgi:TRAP-type C4-dicarboxylate transport system permease small subunit